MKNQLNLPKTDFPQKANGNEREPDFNKKWYDAVFNKRNMLNTGKEFVLHDGPPYANGTSHMGHALNKLLKDVVNKYMLLNGRKVNFKPGWDCHGLPTELKVLKQYPNLSNKELRSKCTEHALKYVEKQKQFFKRLGLFGEWDNPYLTMNKDYETKQLEAFYKLYSKNLLYRSEKPVYYSPSTKTVLANAELEYYNRTDKSVYFKFPTTKGFSLVCWTTMTWTVLGNKGVCVNPNFNYKVVNYNNEKLLVQEDCSLFGDNVLETYKGSDLEFLEYTNLNGKGFVMTDNYVKKGEGTGLVHLCPAHGDDDFKVCTRYGVEAENLLDMDGNLLVNKLYCLDEGSEYVYSLLKENDMFLYEKMVTHSYPHDWRSKQCVVFKLSKQFFLRLEDKEGMLKEANKVDFSKNSYKNRFKNMLYDRKDWCVSRQRVWGFPLPVFYNGDEVVFNEEVYLHLKQLFEKYGSDCWFNLEVDELLPENYRNKNLTKSTDTLDVWLDSGLSWHNSLNKDADLYFEGSDQHRGWFQSSFTTSYLLQGKAPYKKVLTHGFVLDQNGNKMSKSLGNVLDPLKVVNTYNSDVLRLWALSVDYVNDVKVGENVLKTNSKVYFKLRNMFRYLLSNLHDYTLNEEDFKHLSEKDHKMLKDLNVYLSKMKESYTNYKFKQLYNLTVNFTSNMSKRYFDLDSKTVLYEYDKDSKERRSLQYVMTKVLESLVVYLTPMTPYLCEDVYQYMNKKDSVFYELLK